MTLRAWLDEHLPTHSALISGTPGSPAWAGPAPDTDRDRALAWRLHIELATRITTQPLGFRSGDDAAALESLGTFFKTTREAVVSSGPCGTAELAVCLLNETLRPFTARWHREALRGRLSRDDGQRRFRVELEALRLRLRWWDALFRHIADGSPMGVLPSLEGRPPVVEVRTADRRSLPHPEVDAAEQGRLPKLPPDGERPLPFAIAFSGGGIRSASFCLGVMLGLARTRVYESADYVSAVSGGGYLVTLLRSARDVAPGLGANPLRPPRVGEPVLLTQVRARSNSMWDRWPVAVLRVALAWSLSAGCIAWFLGVVALVVLLLSGLVGGTADPGVAATLSRPLVWIIVAVGVLLPLSPGLDSMSPAAFYLAYLKRIWVVEPNPALAEAARRAASEGVAPASPDRPIFLRTATHNRGVRASGQDAHDNERLGDVATFSAGLIDIGGSRPEALPHAISDEDAMAVCGAAVAPSLGIGTKAWLRPLLALVGARLGRWIRVKHPARWRSGPPLYLFVCEMFGLPDPTGRFRFFSDGGHIENLGVYPLLRRRVPYILAIDGEADPTMAFDGLRQLQRLAYIDLGVELDIDTTSLEPDAKGLSDTHVLVIPVHYPAVPEVPAERPGDPPKAPALPPSEGVILYVKSSMTGDEPSHVLGYKQTHPSFPHESTMIQWFNERQFEAYRALGEHVGRQLVAPEWLGPSLPAPDKLDGPTWVQWLRSRVEQT